MRGTRPIHLICLLAFSLAMPLVAQAPIAHVLTNADVVKMVKGRVFRRALSYVKSKCRRPISRPTRRP